jgi:hypothetical protein
MRYALLLRIGNFQTPDGGLELGGREFGRIKRPREQEQNCSGVTVHNNPLKNQ